MKYEVVRDGDKIKSIRMNYTPEEMVIVKSAMRSLELELRLIDTYHQGLVDELYLERCRRMNVEIQKI